MNAKEADRLRTLQSYRILDTAPEREFDDLAILAAQICETPIALVTLIDEKRQWFKAKLGITTSETARDVAFCDHCILDPHQLFEVPDAETDHRFAKSPLVTGDPFIRFYAGAPLVAFDGHPLGALCVMDRRPRELTAPQRSALQALSRYAVAQLELRRQKKGLMEEVERRLQMEEALRDQNERLEKSRTEMTGLLDLAQQSRHALLCVLEDEQNTSRALAHTNRALQMLSRCNEALIAARDEPSLLATICEIAVDPGGHLMAWVGYAQDDDGKSILPVARAGVDTDYLDHLALSWGEDQPGGRGPSGQCIRTGRPVVCPDIRSSSFPFYARDEAEKRGYRSVTCLPLKEGDRVFGLLGLYSGESREIEPEEMKPLHELADDLAFGIATLRSRAVRERAEADLVSSLREKEALLKEVHHRVKNNLQVITSLLRIEARRMQHETTRSVLAQMQGRIYSMALLHETLYRSGNFAAVDLGAYLGQLAEQVIRAQVTLRTAPRLHLDLAAVEVDIDHAIPCGLILNELISNSLKHGFPDGSEGEIRVRLGPSPSGEGLALSVHDNGVGVPEDLDVRRSQTLGLQLVSDLARQIHGSLNVGVGPGATFEVTLDPQRLRSPSRF